MLESKFMNPQKVVETTFHVRYAETDQMGIVHHSSYAIWLEEGRSEWMRVNGSSYAEFEANGLRLAVSELNIRFQRAALYDQRVTIRCWIDTVHSRQVQFSYEVIDAANGAILATGYSKHICLDTQNAVARIPDQWRAILAKAAAGTNR